MNEEINARLGIIEKRLDILEGKTSKKNGIGNLGNKKSYSGLVGGIRFLIDNKKFNQPKSVAEAFEELKKEGYHYPKKSVEKLLSINFTKNQKVLNRIKENKKWKYVIRK